MLHTMQMTGWHWVLLMLLMIQSQGYDECPPQACALCPLRSMPCSPELQRPNACAGSACPGDSAREHLLDEGEDESEGGEARGSRQEREDLLRWRRFRVGEVLTKGPQADLVELQPQGWVVRVQDLGRDHLVQLHPRSARPQQASLAACQSMEVLG